MFGLLYFLIAILGLFILVKILSLPIKILIRLIINAIIGTIILHIINFFGAAIGFTLNITLLNSLIAGFFGVPGVVFLIIWKLIF
jgi:inhibitor of the pro-sigma K processing machinery